MPKPKIPRKATNDVSVCQWVSASEAFKAFAIHTGGTQSAKHIKPLHWYIACRFVLEGGFDPNHIKPRPPFEIMRKGKRVVLSYRPESARGGEQVVLGGLKTKNVDVVVTRPGVGPVMAVSCKGATKAFRNLTNRMEETIGECTNLHITYPAMVMGYFAIIRANRTLEDAREAPSLETDQEASLTADSNEEEPSSAGDPEKMKANDLAILENGQVTDGISRFHDALSLMTMRRGIRNEISRYEAIAMALIEPRGEGAGSVVATFPPHDSPLRLEEFFKAMYQRYDERFVYGAPLLAERGITPRLQWAPDSPVFTRSESDSWPILDFDPRKAAE